MGGYANSRFYVFRLYRYKISRFLGWVLFCLILTVDICSCSLNASLDYSCNFIFFLQMAEEENLDHLLVHPRATWNYNITINTHCLHKLISDVDKILDRAGERAEFESGCFGHYLDFPKGGYFQAQFIHSLLLRQIFIPGGSEDELWFALGKTKARFGKREFCLCTGLKFGRLSDIPSREYEVVPGGIHARYFQGRKKVVIADLKAPFMAEDFDRPHDALKLALLLFANRVLFGQDDRNQVAYWMFSLVEDVQAFHNFAWGHYVFKMTLHYIRQGFKVPADPLGPTTRYNLYGFIWALQVIF
jgi:hypothetical protein